jgi:hypothetical protein
MGEEMSLSTVLQRLPPRMHICRSSIFEKAGPPQLGVAGGAPKVPQIEAA